MTHETEAPPDPAMATAEPPVTAQRQRLTKPSSESACAAIGADGARRSVRDSDRAGRGRARSQAEHRHPADEQGTDETQALLDAVGLRGNLSGEARDIARLIERRLAALAADNHRTRTHPLSTTSRYSERSSSIVSSDR